MVRDFGGTSGTAAASGDAVTFDCSGYGSCGIDVRGVITLTLTVEATIDNTNWFTASMNPVAGGAAVSTATAAGSWTANTSGYARIRMRCSAYTSGTATVAFMGEAAGSANIIATVTADTEFPTAAALADTTTNPTTTLVGANLEVFNGTTWDRVKSAGVTGSVTVGGPTAAAAAIAANPLTIGGRGSTTNPTAVADGQAVNVYLDKEGRIVPSNTHCRALVVQGAVVTVTDTTETTVIAAGATGVFHDLTSIKLSNTSATAVRADIRDITGSTVVDTFYLPAGDIRSVVYQTPFTQTTASNNWTVKLSATVVDVRVIATAVKNI